MRGASLAASVALALLLAGCGKEHRAERAHPPRPVVTAAAERITERQVGPFAGMVEARFKTGLGFRVAGRVVARDARVGDAVKAGAVLAELDPTQQRLELARADADVANGEAQVANAGAEFDRKAQLFDRGVVPQSALDLARSNRDTAAARLDALRATDAKAREALGYAVLRAEFDGVVTRWQTEVGQEVQAGQTVVETVRPDVREAVVDLPVAVVRALPVDPAFTVWLDGDPATAVAARLRETGPLADARTRTQRLRLTLADPPDAFRLGSTVQVTATEAAAPRLSLPAAALFDEGGRSFVWTVERDGRIARRAVTVESREGDRVTAAGDLPDGTPVVVAGVHSLREGQAVRADRDQVGSPDRVETLGNTENESCCREPRRAAEDRP